jgi:hypothetical protein
MYVLHTMQYIDFKIFILKTQYTIYFLKFDLACSF